MSQTCRIELDGKSLEFPEVKGTENKRAIDISTLRDRTGYITLDDGYGNTGSCKSAITYIDGDRASCVIAASRLSNWPSTAPLSKPPGWSSGPAAHGRGTRQFQPPANPERNDA